ncbi:hypothetical protein IV203_031981 [Nitzschia inconspicua]|uniref:Uncharacterized protein n=1 Tax=Nitzschia inconspicua TaxID=303405 RepID=A0A9K3Q339_9STRA|nr:hypothetical protein IV203_031981 [Nitzschia inconspicua]
MRKLMLPRSRRSPTAVEEGALMLDAVVQEEQDDDDESHDYDSFGSLPKGEISRRIRTGIGRKSRSLVSTPQGMRLNNSSIDDGSSTVRRAAVAMDSRLFRRRRHRPQNYPRDPPTQGSNSSSNKRSTRDQIQTAEDRHDMHDDRSFHSYYDRISSSERRSRMTGYRPSHSFSSSQMSDETQQDDLEQELEEHPQRRVQPFRAIDSNNQLPPRPLQPGERPQPRLSRSGSLSMSGGSSTTSSEDVVIYLPEDSKYLLYGHSDWAELPTQKTDPELGQIRQRFLRQNSSLSSNHSIPDGSVMPGSNSRLGPLYSNEDELDTEGLPKGFFRRKDGVIQSFGSSNESSSRRKPRYVKRPSQHDQRTQYTEEKDDQTTEWSETRSTGPGESIDATKYGTPMAWLPDQNGNAGSTVSYTNNDSTYETYNHESTVQSEVESDRNKDNGLMFALVRSFEETFGEFQSGNRRNNSKSVDQRRGSSNDNKSVVSNASTPSSIRRAKIKPTAVPPAKMAMESSRSTTIHHTAPHVPIVPGKWGFDPARHNSFSESEGYDDSTITTKESKMPRNRAIVDVSPLPQNERPLYLEPLAEEQFDQYQPVPETNGMLEDPDNSILQTQNKEEMEQQPNVDPYLEHDEKYVRKDDRSFQNPVEPVYEYPEPTRRGDRVPEMVPGGGATGAPSVVSDISSLPKPMDTDRNFVDFASTNGYGGFSVDDNVTGFIDKMALALRLAIFQPNGCR